MPSVHGHGGHSPFLMLRWEADRRVQIRAWDRCGRITEYRHEAPRSGGVFFVWMPFSLDGRFIHNYVIQYISQIVKRFHDGGSWVWCGTDICEKGGGVMTSSKEYLDFILEQFSDLQNIFSLINFFLIFLYIFKIFNLI